MPRGIAPRLLAFDVAMRRTGWALVQGEQLLDIGSYQYNPKREPLRSVERGLKVLLYKLAPDRAVAECLAVMPKQGGTLAIMQQAKMRAVVQMACEKTGVPYEEMDVRQVRRLLVGKANARKETVRPALRARGYGDGGWNDDECDAVALGLAWWDAHRMAYMMALDPAVVGRGEVSA